MNFDERQSSVLCLEPACADWPPGAHADLLGRILDDQRDLTAVERFAQIHEDVRQPLLGRYYSALVPAHPPGPGEQLAFEVDLDRCSGCKACVTACHNLNGLDQGESWRDVSLVVGGRDDLPVLQHVTSACHHCLEPACLSACPVDAYEKDSLTGIVRHLDDQCFGCQYCTWACPYGAPKFHAAKGIVRKCDMCHGRLAVGEPPACAAACPHEAIHIRVVDRAGVAARNDGVALSPRGSKRTDPLPATHYATTRLDHRDIFHPIEDQRVEPEHAHWPLVVMLVLTQLSVGGFVLEWFAVLAGSALGVGTRLHPALCLALCWPGLMASALHLGRPMYAYRALVGVKHSWLSREVVAFGLFAALATIYVIALLVRPDWLGAARVVLLTFVVWAGTTGVACSVLVYHVVRRPWWHASYGAIKFAATALVLGLATALAALAIGSAGQHTMSGVPPWRSPLGFIAVGVISVSLAKLWYEARLKHGLSHSDLPSLQQTALLIVGPLARPARLRYALGVVGGVLLPALALASAGRGYRQLAAAAAVLGLAAAIGGEIGERYLFFTAVVPPKAVGGLVL